MQTVWTNGIVENEIQVTAPREPLTIVEKNVAAGSCPFLYAWDGKRFRFVTDLLGNSPLGLSVRRGEVLASDFPPLPPGRARTFFFYSVGWDKDGDHDVVDGDTVEPLPVAAAAGDAWRIRYNTRCVPKDWPAREP